MKKLETEFTKDIFTYKQLKRTDRVAMYAQYFEDKLISTEIFKIRVAPEQELFGKLLPEREIYPNNEQFGISALSISNNPEKVERKYNELISSLESE